MFRAPMRCCAMHSMARHPCADRLETAARSMIGVSFRPQGRGPGGCDCLGLVLIVAREAGIRINVPPQPLRGVGAADARKLLARFGCRVVEPVEAAVGDVMVQVPATLQLHLAVRVRGGLVEAHAGLRRVVVRPIGPEECWDSVWRLPLGEL
jgi:hypothetical protein